MGILEFIVIAAVLGLIAWALTTFVPMPQQIRTIIIIAVVIVLVLILLKALGVLDGSADVQIPKIN